MREQSLDLLNTSTNDSLKIKFPNSLIICTFVIE